MLLVFDSNYIGYQAAHTMGDLSFEDAATGVIYGFLSRILSLSKVFSTNQVAFAWDSKHSYRRERYPLYKANRRANKDPEVQQALNEAYSQFRTLRVDILPRIGFRNVFLQSGIEADDIMAKICQGFLDDVIIISSDEDLLQLLFPNVRMYNPVKREMWTSNRLEKDRGLPSSDWARMKQITGCSTDNVAGIQGVGEKTAVKYMRNELKETTAKFKSIETEEGQAIIDRNQYLIRLPIPETRDVEIISDKLSWEGLEIVCEEFGLRSFVEGDRRADWEQFFEGFTSVEMPKREGKKLVKTRRAKRKSRRRN